MVSQASQETAPDGDFFEIIDSYDEVNEKNAQLGWNIHYMQLKTGEYAGRLAGLDVGNSTLVAEKFITPLEILGDIHGGRVVLAFATTRSGKGAYANHHDFCSSAFLLEPGGELDITLVDETTVAQVYVDSAVFYRSWDMLAPGLAPFQFGYHGLVPLPSGIGTSCYGNILCMARGEYPSEQAKEEYLASLLALLAEQALLRSSQPLERPQAAARARLLARAADYIEAHLAEPIKLPELCAYAGTSISTLSRIFSDHYGKSPAAYIRWRRLYACHQRLQQCDPTEQSVGEVIQSCGISHPGRFASEYQRFFGESPKRTMGYLSQQAPCELPR